MQSNTSVHFNEAYNVQVCFVFFDTIRDVLIKLYVSVNGNGWPAHLLRATEVQ